MDNLKKHPRVKFKKWKGGIDTVKIVIDVYLLSNFENKIYGGEK